MESNSDSVDNSQNVPAESDPSQNVPSEDNPSQDVPAQDNPTQDVPSENDPAQDVPTEDDPTQEDPTVNDPAVDDPTVNDPAVDDPAINEGEAFVDFDGVMLFALERAVSSGVDYTIAVSPSGMHRLTINSAPNGVIPENFISMSEFNSYRNTISEIVIAPSVTQIGKAAFRNMLNLSTVTVRANGGIAPALQVIGQEAFAGCSILRSINLEACTNLTTIEGDSVDKNYATSGAFTRSGLYSVTIPASVTNIGAGAFYGCPALQNVNFEPNVNDMTLGSHIFSNCVVLQGKI